MIGSNATSRRTMLLAAGGLAAAFGLPATAVAAAAATKTMDGSVGKNIAVADGT